MKKHNDKILPLELIKHYNKHYPNCFNQVDDIRNNASDGDWNKDLCYIPIAATLSIMMQYKLVDISNTPDELAALSAWRQDKQILVFDDDLAETLYKQADDLTLPVDVLLRLPYRCVFIQTSKTKFFVWIEHDYNTKNHQLRFKIYGKELPVPLIVDLKEGYNLLKGVTMPMLQAFKQLPSFRESSFVDLCQNLHKDARKLIQLVLYICSDKPDVIENYEQKKIYKKSNIVRDVFREVRKWEVGVRYGNAFKKYKQTIQENKGDGEIEIQNSKNELEDEANIEVKMIHTSRKRPHIRRGHWHRFWIGKKDSEDRKLIFRWIPPLEIGFDTIDESNEIPTTINKVD